MRPSFSFVWNRTLVEVDVSECDHIHKLRELGQGCDGCHVAIRVGIGYDASMIQFTAIQLNAKQAKCIWEMIEMFSLDVRDDPEAYGDSISPERMVAMMEVLEGKTGQGI